MPYIPSNRVETKYSNGDLFTPRGEPYVGDYIFYNGNIYSGNRWLGNNQRLFTQEEIQSPSRVLPTLPFLVNSLVPAPSKPRPTQEDYSKGAFVRYFVKARNNSLSMYEVSLSEYSRVLDDNNLNSTFKTEVITWSLNSAITNERTLNRLISAGYTEIKNILPPNDWFLKLENLDIATVIPDTPNGCVESSIKEIRNPRYRSNINSIIREAAKRGLNKKATAALLAIAGGESSWTPKEEGYIYTTESGLRTTFATGFDEGHYVRLREIIDNRRGRVEFFKIVYGEVNPGRVGNLSVEDGGVYYGRGIVQLTGRGNYEKYGRALGLDLINNPELVLDPRYTFKIAVEYYMDRVKASEDDPDFINKAIDSFGNVPTKEQREKKVNFYNCFLNILPG